LGAKSWRIGHERIGVYEQIILLKEYFLKERKMQKTGVIMYDGHKKVIQTKLIYEGGFHILKKDQKCYLKIKSDKCISRGHIILFPKIIIFIYFFVCVLGVLEYVKTL